MIMCNFIECGVPTCQNENQERCCEAFPENRFRLQHKHAFKSHILTKMSTKRKRQLRGASLLHPSDVAKVERMLRVR